VFITVKCYYSFSSWNSCVIYIEAHLIPILEADRRRGRQKQTNKQTNTEKWFRVPPDLFFLRSSKTPNATFRHRFLISDLNPWSGSTGRILIPHFKILIPYFVISVYQIRSWFLIPFRIHILRVGGVILTHYSTSELWCQKIFFIRHWFHLSLRKKKRLFPSYFCFSFAHNISSIFSRKWG